MKKKVVHIAQSAGGVAEYLYMLLKNFDNKEYENILIVSEDYREQLEKFEKYVSKIYFVDMVRDIKMYSDIKSILVIKKILNKIKPDIAYLHSSKAGAFGRIALWFNNKVKVIYNAHGWAFNAKISNKKKKFYIFIEKLLALKTDLIVNISQSEYDTALEYKIASKKKMCVIENGIDFSKFKNQDKYRNDIRNELNIKDDEIVIGQVGRLDEQKDPMSLIKAFKMICSEYNNVKLLFVGSGKLEDELKKYINENKLQDKVIIIGWVYNVEKYIPAFDIATLTSKWEGFGLVLIEYMVCQKPIIATKVGGIENIIQDGDNGLLVDVEDYKEISNSIIKLINDKLLAQNLVDFNNEYKYKYDVNNMVKHIEKIYNQCIN